MRNLFSPGWRSCLLLALGLAVLPITQDRPAATSPTVVISQVYGGGGNSGAIYTNDFVELYNRGDVPVSLTGMSIQYASATGTGNFGANAVTALSGTLQPGAYYLVQLAGGAIGTALPTPDATGTVNMSGSGGKVALVNSTAGLACNGAGTKVCTAEQLALIVDLVGWGSANFYEGSAAAPSTNNATAVLRLNNGKTETDNNAADFATGAPSPRSSGTVPPSGVGSANPASIAIGESTLFTVTVTPGAIPTSTGLAVTIDLSSIGGSSAQPMFDDGTNGDATAADNVFSLQAAAAAGSTSGFHTVKAAITDAQARAATASIRLAVGALPLAIHDIQGRDDTSPYADQFVSTTGVVTAVKTKGSKGFFIQVPDLQADADRRTSEGLFVYTGSAPSADAAVGNLVKVVGEVQEYIPSSDPLSPPTTEISGSPMVIYLAAGSEIPAATRLTERDLNRGGRHHWLERYEGMRVAVAALRVVAPTGGSVTESTATATSDGTFVGVLPRTPRPFREPGLDAAEPWPADAPAGTPRFDSNPERIAVNSAPKTDSTPIEVATGAFVADIAGPLDFVYRLYTVVLDGSATPRVMPGMTEAIPVSVPDENQFTVASFNLERFFDTTADAGVSDAVLTAEAFAGRLNKASLAIRHVLQTPDILGVAEVENLATLEALAAKVNADAAAEGDPNPSYVAYLAEGNDVGGIDVGFLVKAGDAEVPRVSVTDVTQVGKAATYVLPDGTSALLNDRPPLVLRAVVTHPWGGDGFPITVIVNHLRSLSGIGEEDGARVRAKRKAQAEFLAAEIQARQAAGERVVAVGDFNAFQFSDGYVDVMGAIVGRPAPASQVVLPTSDLVHPNLVDLIDRLPPTERYSYLMDGNAQVLDHIVVTHDLLRAARIEMARNDTDFPESYRNDWTRPERLSDHDAPVAYFTFPPPPPRHPGHHGGR